MSIDRHPPRRVLVVGTSGSGKSSFARRLAARIDAPVVELDASYHQADWGEPHRDWFLEHIARIAAEPRWIVDGNYRMARDVLVPRADTIVWLDYSRTTVMVRVIRRTFGRIVLRKVLWRGNRERLRNLVTRDPEENIVLWAWTTHLLNRNRYESEMLEDPSRQHLRWHRLRTPSEAEVLLDRLCCEGRSDSS